MRYSETRERIICGNEANSPRHQEDLYPQQDEILVTGTNSDQPPDPDERAPGTSHFTTARVSQADAPLEPEYAVND